MNKGKSLAARDDNSLTTAENIMCLQYFFRHIISAYGKRRPAIAAAEAKSDTPRGAGGLMSWAASKAG